VTPLLGFSVEQGKRLKMAIESWEKHVPGKYYKYPFVAKCVDKPLAREASSVNLPISISTIPI